MIHGLHELGFHKIAVMDDGSSDDCQKLFFRITNHGKECPDPRSGLRGFPASLKKLALCTEGKSYDYELNFLDAAIQKTPVVVVPISLETPDYSSPQAVRSSQDPR